MLVVLAASISQQSSSRGSAAPPGTCLTAGHGGDGDPRSCTTSPPDKSSYSMFAKAAADYGCWGRDTWAGSQQRGAPSPAVGTRCLWKPHQDPQRAPKAAGQSLERAFEGQVSVEINPAGVGVGDSAEEHFLGPWAAVST